MMGCSWPPLLKGFESAFSSLYACPDIKKTEREYGPLQLIVRKIALRYAACRRHPISATSIPLLAPSNQEIARAQASWKTCYHYWLAAMPAEPYRPFHVLLASSLSRAVFYRSKQTFHSISPRSSLSGCRGLQCIDLYCASQCIEQRFI
jgi:hypothetical protein